MIMDNSKLKHILIGGLIAYEEGCDHEPDADELIAELDRLIDSINEDD